MGYLRQVMMSLRNVYRVVQWLIAHFLRKKRGVLLGAFAACAMGCSDADRSTRVWTERRTSVLPEPTGDPHAGLDMAGLGAPPAAAPALESVHWTTPEGWESATGSGNRLGTITVPQDGAEEPITGTITMFPGDVGGIEANVDRWIGQLGIEHPGADARDEFLNAQTSFVTEGGYPALLLDFRTLETAEKAEKSMLAAIVTRDDSTVFVKFTANAASMDSVKPGFLALTKSIHGADH